MIALGGAIGAFLGVVVVAALRPWLDHMWNHLRIVLARRRDRASWTSICGACNKEFRS